MNILIVLFFTFLGAGVVITALLSEGGKVGSITKGFAYVAGSIMTFLGLWFSTW